MHSFGVCEFVNTTMGPANGLYICIHLCDVAVKCLWCSGEVYYKCLLANVKCKKLSVLVKSICSTTRWQPGCGTSLNTAVWLVTLECARSFLTSSLCSSATLIAYQSGMYNCKITQYLAYIT